MIDEPENALLTEAANQLVETAVTRTEMKVKTGVDLSVNFCTFGKVNLKQNFEREIMEDIYCPNCKGKLNIDGNIVFSVKTIDEKVGLIFLINKPGDYQVIKHPSFNFEKGELVHFHCPICHKDLMAMDVNENLVKVLKTDDEGNTYEVLFSGIAGEHCTYVVKPKQVESYGEDFDKYSSYFHDIVHF